MRFAYAERLCRPLFFPDAAVPQTGKHGPAHIPAVPLTGGFAFGEKDTRSPPWASVGHAMLKYRRRYFFLTIMPYICPRNGFPGVSPDPGDEKGMP